MLKNHTASGQALGYYFQLERALSWIAQVPAGSTVGIETEDDVTIALLNGEKILEQDKSSTTNYPFAPSRPDLWKTLFIWLDALFNREIDINKTLFFLVTNKTSTSSLAMQLANAKNSTEITEALQLLKSEANKITGDAKSFADKVFAFDDTLIKQMIEKIEYKSGQGVYGDSLKNQLYSDLQLDVENPQINDSIVTQLLGWLFFQVTDAWRNKRPALISRDDFMREKLNIIGTYRQKVLNEIIIELGQIPQYEERQEWNKNYVKQLEYVECDKEEILSAIHDYLNAVAKRTSMAMAGYLTLEQIDELDKSLESRWTNIFRLTQLRQKDSSDVDKGKMCLWETMNYDTSIGEYHLRNHFLTRGSYHSLSNNLAVGWHPNFKSLIDTKTLLINPPKESNDE